MRAIFIAKGPAFPHPERSMVDAFQNTEVYNIVCDSLGLEPKHNNGTIRLPFTVSGLHDAETIDLPEDLDDFEIVHPLLPPEIPKIVGMPSTEAAVVVATSSEPAVSETSSPAIATSEPEDVGDGDDDAADQQASSNTSSWLEWVNGKFQAVKDWATDKFGSHKTSNNNQNPP